MSGQDHRSLGASDEREMVGECGRCVGRRDSGWKAVFGRAGAIIVAVMAGWCADAVSAPAQAQAVGCWLGGGAPPLTFPVNNIKVYARDSFINEVIGNPAFTSAQKEQMVRQIVGKFYADVGSKLSLEWAGVDNSKKCDHGESALAQPHIVLEIVTLGGTSWAETTYRPKPGTSEYNCATVKFNTPTMPMQTPETFRGLLLHELGHTVTMIHADGVDCPHTSTHEWGCLFNSHGCCRHIGGGHCNSAQPIGEKIYYSHFEQPDKLNLRTDVGRAAATVKERHGAGFPPPN